MEVVKNECIHFDFFLLNDQFILPLVKNTCNLPQLVYLVEWQIPEITLTEVQWWFVARLHDVKEVLL